MTELCENIFNRNRGREEKKYKLWRHAGLMLTYRCPAACEFCYYYCGPQKDGLMTLETAICAWEGLRRLAGNDAKVHLTGGEPFMYPERLFEILTEAGRCGLGPVDLVETNGFWATDRREVIEQLKRLKSLHLHRFKISWDPFHAEYIEAGRLRLLIDCALEVFGPERILVRWEKYLDETGSLLQKHTSRRERLISAAREAPCRYTGRAGGLLADLMAETPPESLPAHSCGRSFMEAKGVHIDPFGNVFSGQCSGIIFGNVNDTPLDRIWKQTDPREMPLIDILFSRGPTGLLDIAVPMGYKKKNLYAGRCHVCSHVRQFFFDKKAFRPIIGPDQCYAGPDETEALAGQEEIGD